LLSLRYDTPSSGTVALPDGHPFQNFPTAFVDGNGFWTDSEFRTGVNFPPDQMWVTIFFTNVSVLIAEDRNDQQNSREHFICVRGGSNPMINR